MVKEDLPQALVIFRKNVFVVRVRCWHRLPGEVVGALWLLVLERRLGNALINAILIFN